MPTAHAIPDPEVLARELKRVQQESKSKHRSSNKRKRSDDKDDPPGKVRKLDKKTAKGGKKNGKSTRKKRGRGGDDLFDYDENMRELPTLEDFSRPYGPSRSAYVFGDAPPVKDIDMEDVLAPQPAIPDANDDSRREVKRSPDQGNNKKRPKKGKKSGKVSHGNTKQVKKTPRVRPPLPTFLRIPLEVREEIYRNILVAPKPVLVRAGWTRIYEREKPCLDTNILRVCKQINQEAVRIIYGENTFHYRLRDPPNTGREVTDIQGLAEDDYKTDIETDDDDSRDLEYGGRSSGRTSGRKSGRSSGRSSRKHAETHWDINIPKFGILFRHLIVEAEHNRYSLDTQYNMARAISVFTAQSGDENITKAYTDKGSKGKGKGKAKATNIHTLSIRVAPMWNNEKEDFTFVDFFKEELPVLEAMTALSCQFLCVELLTKHLNPQAGCPGSRLLMDMRHRRIARRATRGIDIWENDKLMLHERVRRVYESMNALKRLEGTVKNWCLKYAPDYHSDLEEWELGFNDMTDVEDWGEF